MDVNMDENIANKTTTTMIPLHEGAPDKTLIPFDLISNAAREICADEMGRQNRTYWTYSKNDEGAREFRHHLVEFMRHSCAISTLSVENIFITSGVSAILDQICTMFLRAGDTVLVECPTYNYALEIFRDHHLHIVSCSTDDDGLILESNFVTDVLERAQPKMIYLVPTFQNPSGFNMSHHRREQLVQLSVKHNFLIVADEVYHMLDYEKHKRKEQLNGGKLTEHPTSFAAYHAAGTVISLHSFSKVLSPALRIGFACASHEHVIAMGLYGMIRSGSGASPFASGIVGRIVANGSLSKFVDEKLCVELGKRMRTLHNTLMQTFGKNFISCRLPSGGYFLWVIFKDETVDCDQLLVFALKHGVDFKPGRLFAHDAEAKARLANCLRLSVAIAECAELKEGCTRLKRAYEEYKNITM